MNLSSNDENSCRNIYLFLRIDIILSIILSVIFNLNLYSQGYTMLSGQANLPENSKVRIRFQENGKTNVDSTKISNGRFRFLFSNSDSKLVFISIDYLSGSKLLLVSDSTEVKIDPAKIWNSTILYSAESIRFEQVNKYVDSLQHIAQSQMIELNRINMKDDSLRYNLQNELIKRTSNDIYNYKLRYIRNNLSDIISLFFINDVYFVRNNEIEDLLSHLSGKIINHNLYIGLKEKIIKAKAIKPGNTFPIKSIMDISGNQIDIVGLPSKYILINFWGTWCGPCIKEMPDLVSLYSIYGRGFIDIISIAYENIDKTKRQIINVCKKYKMVWHNSLSYRNIESASSKSIIEKLGVNTFPTNILIDRLNNKIIWVGTGSNSVIELSGILKQRTGD